MPNYGMQSRAATLGGVTNVMVKLPDHGSCGVTARSVLSRNTGITAPCNVSECVFRTANAWRSLRADDVGGATSFRGFYPPKSKNEIGLKFPLYFSLFSPFSLHFSLYSFFYSLLLFVSIISFFSYSSFSFFLTRSILSFPFREW